MNNKISKIGKLILSVALPLGAAQGIVSSCQDYLYIKPLNQIVEDNYWDRKEDVESVLYGCYSGLQEKGCLQRMFVWGEVRSENITYTSSTTTPLKQIIGENILETNEWVKWKDFYQVINRCNTVILNAPKVQELDPNYNESDMLGHIAEATWIRSLCYFYLVRTFRDIPYTNKPSINDKNIEQDYALAPLPMQELLTTINDDLEAVMDDALRYFPLKRNSHAIFNDDNTSRVTKCAFYALLADINLWRNQFDKVLDYSDKVFQYKRDLYEDAKKEDEDYVEGIELINDKYLLIPEKYLSNTIGYAYKQIFGTGNSFESIFELYFEDTKSPENEIVKTFFGNRDHSVGECAGHYKVRALSFEGDNDLFAKTDYRAAEYFENKDPDYPIRKYYYSRVEITPNMGATKDPQMNPSVSSQSYQNWIIYRMTDVMLMRAEALIELGGKEQMEEAFELISTVYNRGNVLKSTDADCLKAEEFDSQEKMRELIKKERNRELIFEGKRWFDLVRFALREGSNDQLINTVVAKQKERPTAVRIQLRSRDALFWPYEKTEIDVNKNLTQNSAYITNETSQK